ncbi:hypothetical protein C8R43DRAFT_1141539 [Mycena crocata]|nr:hypothetical protein C8R43DRAFT_1141539 [Mycena crocata]
MAPTPTFVSARDLSDFTPPKDPLFGATPVPTGPTEGPLFNIPPLPEPHQTQPWDFPPWTGTALAIILITGCCIFALWIVVDCWLGDAWWGHSCGMKRKLTMAEKCAILDAKKAAEAAEAVSQNASTEAKALESTNATPEFHGASTETLVVPQIATPATVHFAVSAFFRVTPPNTLQNKRQSTRSVGLAVGDAVHWMPQYEYFPPSDGFIIPSLAPSKTPSPSHRCISFDKEPVLERKLGVLKNLHPLLAGLVAS